MKKLFIISLIIFIPTIILVSQTEQRLAAENYLKQSEKIISDKSPKITIYPYSGKKIQAVFIKYENDSLFYYDLNTKTESQITLFKIKQIFIQNGLTVFMGNDYKKRLQMSPTEVQQIALKEIEKTQTSEGEQITTNEYVKAQKEKGLIYYNGQWITPNKRDLIELENRLEKKIKSINPDGEIGVPYLKIGGGVESGFTEIENVENSWSYPLISAGIIYPANESLTIGIDFIYENVNDEIYGIKRTGNIKVATAYVKIRLK